MTNDRIRQAIEDEEEGALVPFFTAGYPGRDSTAPLLKAADKAGATVIELGLPFSDSLADGVVVQSSYHHAIEGGMTVKRALDQLREVSKDLRVPVLLMGSINPILALGMGRFVERARKAGAAGVLVPDLPPEDAREFRSLLRANELAPIPLAAPNCPLLRYKKLGELAAGFLYQITRTGTTGARSGNLPRGLAKRVARARQTVKLPVCLGFGISTPEQVRQAWRIADGAVVGSALLRSFEREKSVRNQAKRAREFLEELATAREMR